MSPRHIWITGFGIIIFLLLIGGFATRPSVFAGFTPTPTPTETPTPTPIPTVIPPPPPPPPPPEETPTPTPAPLLPEGGGGSAIPAWPLLALGMLALLAGWLGMKGVKREA